MYHRQPTTQEGHNTKSARNRGAAMLVAAMVLTLAAAGLNVVPAFADRHPGAIHQTNLSANAGGTLAGKYKTTIKSPAAFKGTWVLTLTNRGASPTTARIRSSFTADTRRPDRRSPSVMRPATAPAPHPAPTPGRRQPGHSSSPG
jgi:hypothetical protein